MELQQNDNRQDEFFLVRVPIESKLIAIMALLVSELSQGGLEKWNQDEIWKWMVLVEMVADQS